MRTVSLPDSDREVTIGVFHKKFNRETGEVLEYKDPAQESFFVRRCTFVKLTDRANTTFGDGEISVMSICMPGDNFSKLQGRRLAAMNLLRRLRSVQAYTKTDRKAIFQAICPEFPNV
jgi:hypothetical protein